MLFRQLEYFVAAARKKRSRVSPVSPAMPKPHAASRPRVPYAGLITAVCRMAGNRPWTNRPAMATVRWRQ